MQPRVLITGGAGFIGSHSTELALSRGWEVLVLDDLSTGKTANLPAGVVLEVGSILDLALLERLAAGCTAVLHLAAMVSVPQSIAEPLRSHEINVTGTLTVLEAARRAGIRRVVMASSAAVYGDGAPPLAETAATVPQSPYGVHKLMLEHYGRLYSRLHGMEAVSLRYFNVFGPRQDPRSPYSGVLSRFAEALAAGRPPAIHGDGLQTRDFVFVKDVARANLAALEAGAHTAGRAFNVATGQSRSIREALDAMQQVLGTALEPEYGPGRPGDVRHSLADASLIRDSLGWQAEVDFAEGIRQFAGPVGPAIPSSPSPSPSRQGRPYRAGGHA